MIGRRRSLNDDFHSNWMHLQSFHVKSNVANENQYHQGRVGGRGQIPDGKGLKYRRLTFLHTAAG